MFVFIFYGVVRRIFPSLRMCRRIDIELDSAAPTVSYYYSYSRKRYLCRGWLLLSSSPSPSLSSSRPSCCRCSSSIVSFMRCFGDASSPHNKLLLPPVACDVIHPSFNVLYQIISLSLRVSCQSFSYSYRYRYSYFGSWNQYILRLDRTSFAGRRFYHTYSSSCYRLVRHDQTLLK